MGKAERLPFLFEELIDEILFWEYYLIGIFVDLLF